MATGKKADLKIGIAGLGTVGAAVVRLIAAHGDMLAQRAGHRLVVTAVSARVPDKKRDCDLTGVTFHNDPRALVTDDNVDVVVELVGGDAGAAYDVVVSALAAGKPVVTANKALLSARAADILAALRDGAASIGCEAAVAGGIPAIKALREGLAANDIRAVYGILNGTCNFILSEMRNTGRAFADVLQEAQTRGYAEADPSFDIDGTDTAHKLSILSAMAFGVMPQTARMEISGIRHITPLDISFAGELGYRIKLLGIARKTPAGIAQTVAPSLVPVSVPLSAVEGALNAVYFDGDFSGKVLLTGAGAGGDATASAVVADIIDIARGHNVDLMGIAASDVEKPAVSDPMSSQSAYYMRLMVLDQPGVVAEVSAILRDHAISLESLIQRGRDPGQPVPLVLTTHETTAQEMTAAAAKIAALKTVGETPSILRIEDFK